METTTCSSCQELPGNAGTLRCGHAYCHDCFKRYVHGTADELNRSLRCCVGGAMTLLTFETKRENLLMRFGRDVHPKLEHVTGLATRTNGDYVMADPSQKRVFLFNQYGRHQTDFAYTYKYDVMYGITVDKKDRIIFPTISTDATNPFNTERHVALTYYNMKGFQRGYTYLDKNSDVKGLGVNSKNEVLATDAGNGRVWLVSEMQRVSRWFNLEQEIGELSAPRPWGITLDNEDNYYVTDYANDCVRCYKSDGSLRFRFGNRGEQPGQFKKPTGITIDDQNRIIVADTENHRVQIFNDEGNFERYIVRFNKGSDVYLAPVDVHYVGNNEVAVLLRGIQDACRTEVRVYPGDGPPEVLSC